MQYILIAIVLMVLCLFGLSCRKGPASSTPAKPAGPVTNVASGTYLSRQDIEAQLAYIAKSPPPEVLSIGAMCYKPISAPQRIDYVCSVCGEKTLYAAETSDDGPEHQSYYKTLRTIQSLEQCRRLVQQIKKLDVALHEAAFCKQCAPDVKTPHLDLIIQYPDVTKGTVISDINQTDLLMLKAFLDGDLKYKGLQDREWVLKDQLPRLEELLGVKLDDAE